MLKKENLFTGYLVAGMLLGMSGSIQAAVTMENSSVLPVVLPKAATSLKMSGISSVKPYAQGEVIVVMKENLSALKVSSVLAQKKIKVLKKYSHLSSNSKGSYMLVSGDISTEDLVAQLQKDPNVKSVSPNYRCTMYSTTPNDPGFERDLLWGLHNTGQSVNGTEGTDDADIDAPEAWDTSTGSSDVVVAVFDTGVDYTHKDLSANMWVNSSEADGEIGVDDDDNGYVDDLYGYDFAGGSNGENDPDPMDIMGHGTHVSGTIGAKGDNDVGITGINWDVKIMALKVFRPSLGAYDSDILEAIDYVLTMKDKGVNIVAINASYGGGCGDDYQNSAMNDAIKSLGEKGIIFVAAAGNENNNNDETPSCPASYDASNIIAVAATDQDDTLAYFSNYGETSVDIAAPGTNILSTLPSFAMPDDNIFSDDMESGEGNWTVSDSVSWEITTEESNSSTHAWSDSPDANYTNDANTSLTYGSDIDLSDYAGENIGLGACLKFEIEEDWDYLYIEASNDSGESWTTMVGLTGEQDAWKCNGVVIPENMKTAHFRMRFRLETDDSVVKDGIYIDDIAIGTVSPSESYAYWAGTSMATPHVTGSVALMAAAFPDENVTERKNRILDGVDKLDSLDEKVVTGGRLNIATSITLGDVNHDPVAQNDTATVVENGSVNIAVLSNDSDVDGDTLSISEVTSPENGTATIHGTQITYTPKSDYTGSDSFSYTVSDGNGSTATATVSITVTQEDDESYHGGGGGCTYNPHNKSVDLMVLLMMMASLFYPLRRKYFK